MRFILSAGAGRGVLGKFTPEEAAQLDREINSGLVIPFQYKMFEFNTISPQKVMKAAKRIM